MILVDTHVLLWWLQGDHQFDGETARLLGAGDVEAFVSAASFWEIAITSARGQLRSQADLVKAAREAGFTPLAIEPEDGVVAGGLPLHHKDPFDRMLIAQATRRGLRIVTNDPWFARYGVSVVRA